MGLLQCVQELHGKVVRATYLPAPALARKAPRNTSSPTPSRRNRALQHPAFCTITLSPGDYSRFRSVTKFHHLYDRSTLLNSLPRNFTSVAPRRADAGSWRRQNPLQSTRSIARPNMRSSSRSSAPSTRSGVPTSTRNPRWGIRMSTSFNCSITL